MITKEDALKNYGHIGVSCQDIVRDIYDSIGRCSDCDFARKTDSGSTMYCDASQWNMQVTSEFFCAKFKLRESDNMIWSYTEKEGRYEEYRISTYEKDGKLFIGLDGTPAYYEAKDIIASNSIRSKIMYDNVSFKHEDIPPLCIDFSGKVFGEKMLMLNRMEFYYKAMYHHYKHDVVKAQKEGLFLEKYIYSLGKKVLSRREPDKTILHLYSVSKQWLPLIDEE